ncbi:TonB-dependent receptor plug domain-containing protein [Maribacter flavus]|uniref:TonB-dependent receptor plug domain-containing protein n=1 Tax=Maribacter flavus TaxID=1658664 RepID=A0A5B2TQB9_9FLAO|nr:TonB-dependent receptor plug domain-containing protein [Maribacter flavus]KAA2216504.1 TonB-dependent receptor plug domain-containing protein [Maribacter flavus]
MKKILASIILGLVTIFMVLSYSKISQEYVLLEKVKTKLIDYRQRLAPEKTYLHTDKDVYTNGDTIWFKTYLVDGITHEVSNKSKVVYVDLVNDRDSVVAQRKLFVNDKSVAGDIEIAYKIPQGTYTLRTYTKYMLNDKEPVIYQKQIPIIVQKLEQGPSLDNPMSNRTLEGFGVTASKSVSGIPKIKFYPEGGDLVTELPGTIGIEVLDGNGNGVALKGDIISSEDEIVTSFESHEFGLGRVRFIPREGRKYRASFTVDGKEYAYPLPESVSSGYLLNLQNREDHILVQVASSPDRTLEGTLLVGHLRGDLIFKRIGEPSDKSSYATKIFTSELKDGVAHFTLFASNGEPLAERLVFIDHPNNDAEISFSAPGKVYGKREKVNLDVVLTDANGSPLKGDFSVGVVSKNGIDQGHVNSFKSWLLLNSDLGGRIGDPDFFFKDGSKHRKFLLDALMLTHGWRRFVWKNMLSDTLVKMPKISPEKGIMVRGKTTKFKLPNRPKETFVILNLYGVDLINSKQKTNEQGKFSFGPFYFTDTLEATVEAYDSLAKWDSKKSNFSIALDEQWPRMATTIKGQQVQNTIQISKEYAKEEYQRKVTDYLYDPVGVTQLEEVTVTDKDKRLTRHEMATNSNPTARMTTGPFSSRLFREDVLGNEAMSAMDLLARTPGVRVTGTFPNQRLVIFQSIGNGDPLILVNGTTATVDFLQQLRAIEVEFIDVVKGPDLTIFGSRGAGGVIGIYTNKSYEELVAQEQYPGVVSFKVQGFYKTREFYTPDYYEEDPKKPDYRTTLYWNPDLAFSDAGLSQIDFFTGDKTGMFQVRVEGITEDGRPMAGLYDIEVVD